MNIIWDLDGTLVDSRPVIALAMNQTRVACGLPEKSLEELRPYIGPSVHDTFAHFLQTDDSAQIAEVIAHYRARYQAALDQSPVYPGMVEVLQQLRDSGCQQWVATAKYQPFARELLGVTGLAPYFVEAYGSGDNGEHSHKADLLGFVLAEEGLAPAQTLMIGDTRYDMAAARTHDLTAIGVDWGYGLRAELREAGAHRIVDFPEELMPVIRNSLMCVC
ncbi:MAG: HAD family hydrolase [Saccharospirillum sp.]